MALAVTQVIGMNSHCSHCKHDLHDCMELFDEYPAPFSPEMAMIVIDHNTNVYINIINGNRKKHQSLLLRGIGSGSRSTITTILLPFLAW